MTITDAQSRTVSEQSAPHMSPAQAAKLTGVSRWAVLRAIKSLKLNAFRDNRGNWQISPNDLAEWCGAHVAHSVQGSLIAYPDSASAQDAAQAEIIMSLRADLTKAEHRAALAEAEKRAADALAQERARALDLATRALDTAERNLADLRQILSAPPGSSSARPWWRFWK